MSTLVADKKSLKTLGIIIAVFNIVLALYSLFNQTLYLIGETLPIGKFIINVFNILWIITSVMLLIWFLLMKGHINNGARILAIIGLFILIGLDFFATFTDIYFTPEEKWRYLYSNEFYNVINIAFSFINMILIGVAFVVMSHQLGKGTGSWAMANGIIRLIQALAFILANASSYIIPRFVSYEHLSSTHQLIYTPYRVLILVNYITFIVFFFMFSLKEDK